MTRKTFVSNTRSHRMTYIVLFHYHFGLRYRLLLLFVLKMLTNQTNLHYHCGSSSTLCTHSLTCLLNSSFKSFLKLVIHCERHPYYEVAYSNFVYRCPAEAYII